MFGNRAKKVAVIGGGIFGVTTAIKLAERGHSVTLYEKNDDILKSASSINQFRSHVGYHYPRSEDTINSCINATPTFEDEYSEAIIKNIDQYYCIAKEKSLVSGQEFLSVCNRNSLPVEELPLDIINDEMIDLCVRVNENLINPFVLKQICEERIRKNKIVAHLKRILTKLNVKSAN